MHFTILGANGKVGRLVVEIALKRGHSVTAFVHHRSTLAPHPELTIKKGDAYRGTDIARSLAGCDVVVSALGSWHTEQKNVLSSAMLAVIPAMQQANIRRIVSLTGAAAMDSIDHPTIFDTVQHALANAVAPKILRDGEDHIRLLRDSNLDWTVVRSPVMNEFGAARYTLRDTFPPPWHTINRHAVATCIVDLAGSPDWLRQSPVVYR